MNWLKQPIYFNNSSDSRPSIARQYNTTYWKTPNQKAHIKLFNMITLAS